MKNVGLFDSLFRKRTGQGKAAFDLSAVSRSDSSPDSGASEGGQPDIEEIGERARKAPEPIVPAGDAMTAMHLALVDLKPTATSTSVDEQVLAKIASDTGRAKPVIGPPHMSPAEIAALTGMLADGVKHYLEFGAGGSTLLAIHSGVGTVVSVESDAAWASAVREHPDIAPRVAAGSAVILHADIGPTGQWGVPLSPEFSRLWPNYLSSPWAVWASQNKFPDLVLVDGRFRVASCLSVAIAAALSPIHAPNPAVLIHDFLPERKSYQKLLDFFDLTDQIEALAILRLKPDVGGLPLLLAFLDAQFDWA